MNRRFVLASASPRRKELLSRFIPDFEILPADIDETFFPAKGIEREMERITKLKADTVWRLRTECVIIAADTVVLKDNLVLGKPAGEQDAVSMLKMLRGKAHQVKSCVHVIYPEGQFHFVETTDVMFCNYSDSLIDWYVATGEPFDKAGAYAVQGLGCILVEAIRGDFNNVMGLPLSPLMHRLSHLELYSFNSRD